MTESRSARTARSSGTALCVIAVLLLTAEPPWTSALAIELLAAAFWCWARAAQDAPDQVPRWSWLRRPAMAMWIAVAIHAAFPSLDLDQVHRNATLAMLARIEAGAIAWAALELMAALPLARPYSDLPGPLLEIRTWLPMMLPAAGFVVVWKHGEQAFGVPEVQRIAVPLLVLTALLGALRAFARRNWIATLRWLAVTDAALGALIIARRTAPLEATFLLWLAACGSHAFLLAGEIAGAKPRRGAGLTRLWRTASWVAFAALSWPAMLAARAGSGGFGWLQFVGAAIAVALVAWVMVSRMVAAPERRLVVRPSAAYATTQIGAWLVLILVVTALATAWWFGFEPGFADSIVALAPAVLGGSLAIAARQGRGKPFWSAVRRMGGSAPAIAGGLYGMVVGIERRTVGIVIGIARAIATPLHDLHAGDAQEYLLFLAGLAVLALVAPLVR